MQKLLSFLLTILLLQCSCISSSYQCEEPIYGEMADAITARTVEILSKRHEMRLTGVGGGYIDHVNMLFLGFQIYKPLTIDTAREIIVDCIEEFLFQINNNERIRPYLKNYPFTPKEVEVSISSFTNEGKEVYDPYISVVSNITRHDSNQTKLWYCTEAPDQPFDYKTEIKENYEEALQIVKGKRERGDSTCLESYY